MEHFPIGDRKLPDEQGPYLIAEIGANHNGDMALCRAMIDAAKAAGADAVKFQSWSETSLVSEAHYQRNTSYPDKKRHFGSLREMIQRYRLTPDQHRDIAAYCKEKGITFISTAFSVEEIALLDEIGVPFHKAASMDCNNIPLLEAFAKTGKPVVLSTGMATLDEIRNGVKVLRAHGSPVLLFHCVSVYPTPDELVSLRNIQMLRDTFGLPVGFSDHTSDITAPIAAVALGACMIEKHFTIDRELVGWDHRISADQKIFTDLARECRRTFTMLGTYERHVSEAELTKRLSFRRKAVAGRDLAAGTVLNAEDIAWKRTGIADGFSPDERNALLGKALAKPVTRDFPITAEHLAV